MCVDDDVCVRVRGELYSTFDCCVVDALHHDALATEAAQHSQSDTDVAESGL